MSTEKQIDLDAIAAERARIRAAYLRQGLSASQRLLAAYIIWQCCVPMSSAP